MATNPPKLKPSMLHFCWSSVCSAVRHFRTASQSRTMLSARKYVKYSACLMAFPLQARVAAVIVNSDQFRAGPEIRPVDMEIISKIHALQLQSTENNFTSYPFSRTNGSQG